MHDLDRVEDFINGGVLDTQVCLLASNLYVDLARSVSPVDTSFVSLTDQNSGLYDKLCSASGIPFEGRDLSTPWSSNNERTLRNVLRLGQERIRTRPQLRRRGERLLHLLERVQAAQGGSTRVVGTSGGAVAA